MKVYRILLLIFLIQICHAEVQILDTCGGTIESDSGNINVPANSNFASPGDVCIWTIHLKNRTRFAYYFYPGSFDVPGRDEDCSGGFLAIYPINNFIIGNPEPLKLCNENFKSERFEESGSMLAMVLKIDEYADMRNVTISIGFEGIQQINNAPKHLSTFTTASSGGAQYPFEGEYPPNTIASWIVQPQELTINTQIIVDNVDFEGCTFSDPCLCDAFFIYSVSHSGNLVVADKFCGERESGEVLIQGNKFIGVFFTDILEDPTNGHGFRFIWRAEPTTTPTTTTTLQTTSVIATTEMSTTTEDTNPPIFTTCGGLINATVGKIHYKPDENYENSERCVWLVRSPIYGYDLYLSKERSGFEIGKDYLSIFTFDRYDASFGATLGKTTNEYETRFLEGSVGVIVFTSDSANSGQGFELSFEFNGTAYNYVNVTNDYFSSDVEGSFQLGGPDATDHYGNNQLSVFAMSRNNTYYTDIGWTASLLVYKMQESGIIIDPCYYDGLRVYSVAEESLSFVGKYCSDKEATFGPFLARNLYIFVLTTDYGTDTGGFKITWKLG